MSILCITANVCDILAILGPNLKVRLKFESAIYTNNISLK